MMMIIMKAILIYNIDNSDEYNNAAAVYEGDDNDAEADGDDLCTSGR